jgi:hypothetical protein
MKKFKFFYDEFLNLTENDVNEIHTQMELFARELVTSGEYETTIFPKKYDFLGYSYYVSSVTEGIKINDGGMMPYLEDYHRVIVNYTTNDLINQIRFQFII